MLITPLRRSSLASRCLLWAIPLVAAFIVGAAPAHSRQAAGNAADHYRRAIELIGRIDRERIALLSEWADSGGTTPLTPQLRETLAAAGEAMNAYRRGAALEHSDFGLDYGQGPELMLPHLGPLRQVTRVMAADTLVRVREGDAAGAVRNAEAMMRAAVHIADDRLLISNLVGTAAYALTDGVLDRLLAEGSLDAGDAARLLRAMDVLEDRDPFRMIDGVIAEQSMMVDWLDSAFESEDGVQRFVELMGMDGDDEIMEHVSSIDRETFDGMLDGFDRAMSQAAEIFMMEDREAAMQAMRAWSEEISEGGFGELTLLLAPALDRVLATMHRAEDQIRARRELLAELARGEVLPEDLINAATEYLLIGVRLAELDEALRRALDDPDHALDEDTAEALARMNDMLELATTRRRCDFAPYRRTLDLTLTADAVTLRELLLLLHTSADRSLRGESVSVDSWRKAARALHIQFGMLAHLSGDDHISMALVTREAALRLVPMVERLAEAPSMVNVDADERRETWTALRTAADRLPQGVPFGLSRSVMKLREDAAAAIRQLIHPIQPTSEDDVQAYVVALRDLHDRAAARVGEAMTAEELLSVAALIDLHRRIRRSLSTPESELVERMEQVVSVYDEQAFEALRREAASQSTNQLVRIIADEPDAEPWPVLAPLDEWMGTARRDLRRIRQVVRAAAEPSLQESSESEGDPDEEDTGLRQS